MRMKDLNSRVKGGKIHPKSFPGAKASQLSHYIKSTLEEYKYDCAIIHVGINDILPDKNDIHLNNLPESILEIANTCQNYNIGKIFISALLSSKSIYHKSMKPYNNYVQEIIPYLLSMKI